jgi:hypothetical protein
MQTLAKKSAGYSSALLSPVKSYTPSHVVARFLARLQGAAALTMLVEGW